MSYGLYKATAYYNKLEAWRDWEKILQTAKNISVFEIEKIAPKSSAGWKSIDKSIAKLRELINKQAEAA